MPHLLSSPLILLTPLIFTSLIFTSHTHSSQSHPSHLYFSQHSWGRLDDNTPIPDFFSHLLRCVEEDDEESLMQRALELSMRDMSTEEAAHTATSDAEDEVECSVVDYRVV